MVSSEVSLRSRAPSTQTPPAQGPPPSLLSTRKGLALLSRVLYRSRVPHLMLNRSTLFRSSVTSDPTGIFSMSNSNTTQTHTHIQVSKAASRCSIRSKVSERHGLALGAAPAVEGECGATQFPAPFGGWCCPVGPSPRQTGPVAAQRPGPEHAAGSFCSFLFLSQALQN